MRRALWFATVLRHRRIDGDASVHRGAV